MMTINFGDRVDYVFKIVLDGDSGVGKSQLIARFIKNEFSNDSKATKGVEFQGKSLIIDERKIKAQIWDIAGDERYRAVRQNVYYRRATGAMLVYDMTKRESFDHMTRWLDELRGHTDRNIVIMLIANKCDLASLRAVPIEDAKEFAEREKLFFMETSALEATNVEDAFLTALTEIYRIVKKKSLSADGDDGKSASSKGQASGDDEKSTSLKGQASGDNDKSTSFKGQGLGDDEKSTSLKGQASSQQTEIQNSKKRKRNTTIEIKIYQNDE